MAATFQKMMDPLKDFGQVGSGFLRSIYEPIYKYWNGDEFWMNFWVMFGIITIEFWFFNIFLMSVDFLGWPQWVTKYRVQAPSDRPVKDQKMIGKILRIAIYNTVVWNPLMTLGMCYLRHWRGCSFKPEDTPGIPLLLLEHLITFIIDEGANYYFHRIVHWPIFYKSMHKLHHEWTAPIGLVTYYNTEVEHTWGNMLSPSLGFLLMRSHLTTHWLFFMWAVPYSITFHMGYHIPFLPSPEFHDYHHLKFVGNYGNAGLWDWLHGTDRQYKASIQAKRDFFLTEFKPVIEQIPDKRKHDTSVGSPDDDHWAPINKAD